MRSALPLLLVALASLASAEPSGSVGGGSGVPEAAVGSPSAAASPRNPPATDAREESIAPSPNSGLQLPAGGAPPFEALGAAGAPAAAPPPSAPPAQASAPVPLSVPTASAAPSVVPAPAASVVPSIARRPPEASSAATRAGVTVRLKDSTVFVLRAARAGKSPEERARLTSRALNAAVDDPRAVEVRVVRQGDVAVVYAGPVPLIQLGDQDAELAGDSSLDVHANAIAAQIRQALESERQRSRVAENVFNVSLVVFFGLIAFYLMRKVGDIAERLRDWLHQNGDRVLAIRVQRVEIVRPATLRNSALVGLEIAKWLGQFGIFYAWLVAVLSLFEATRGYTEQLTGLVVTPLSDIMGRLARALPLLLVAVIAALAVFVLVRFVGLFFASVARRETTLAWLPPDLALPTSVLLRFTIVLAALVFAAPVVTGNDEGVLSRAGMVVLVALGLSGTPVLASSLVGSIVLFGRRLRVGDHAEVGGSLGRISAINLLELRLSLADQTELRIPHLMLLGRPLRGLGAMPRIGVEIAVSAEFNPTTVRRLFDEAGSRVGRDVRAEVLGADANGVLYRVTVTCESLDQRSVLWTALLETLSAAGVPLGRGPSRPGQP